MAVNEDVSSYTTVAASNTPAGSDNIGSDLDDHLRDMKKNMAALLDIAEANVKASSGVRGLSFSLSNTSTLIFTAGSVIDTSATANITFAASEKRVLAAGAYAGGDGGNIMESAGGLTANTGYFIWAIYDTTNATADMLASTSGSVGGLVFPGTYNKANLLWYVFADSTPVITPFVQAKNGNRCSYRTDVTATGGPGTTTSKEFVALTLEMAPNFADTLVNFRLTDTGLASKMGIWLADGSTTYTAQTTANNPTMVVEGNSLQIELSNIATTNWVMTDGAKQIRYAHTEDTDASINVRVRGWIMYRRGNAA